MKRFLVLLLAFSMVFALCGCGKTAEDASSNKAQEAQESEKDNVEEISLNDMTVYGDLEFKFDEAAVADHVFIPYPSNSHPDLVSVFRPIVSGDGNKLLYFSGKIKNNSKNDVVLAGNVVADFILDDETTYTGDITFLSISNTGAIKARDLSPYMELALYASVELPEEIADSFSACKLVIGFHKDGFDTAHEGLIMEDTAARYILSASKDENADSYILPEVFEPITYNLADTISTETIDFSFSEIELRTEMSEKYNGTHYLYRDASAGTHNVCLIGNIMSTAPQTLERVTFTGSVEIGEYTYELKTWVFGLKLNPLIETRVILFAEVPDILLDKFETCTFKFAFNENMTNTLFQYGECDYNYIFTFMPEDISNAA